MRELWGVSARLNTKSSYFKSFFEKHRLVDVELANLVPTCRNFCIDEAIIPKRLNHLLVSEYLMVIVFLLKS